MPLSVTTTFTTFSQVNAGGSIGGTEDWGTESNAQNSDDTRAIYTSTAALPHTGYTDYLLAENLVASIPTNATIVGIQIAREARMSTADTTVMKDNSVYLRKAGSTQFGHNGKSAVAYTATDAVALLGGSADMWSNTWTPADLNHANFGVIMLCDITHSEGDEATAEIDSLIPTIYYTLPGGNNLMMLGVG